jgi:hypothetical protein
MATAQENVIKKLQGLKDSRSLVGEMARGKTMYPGGNAAQSGPGGPDMGRPPTAVPQAALEAVKQRMQMGGTPVVTGSQGSAIGNAQKLAADRGMSAQAPGQQVAQQAREQMMGRQAEEQNLTQQQNAVQKQKLNKMRGLTNKKASGLAKAALQAAAQRKITRSR